MNIHNKLHTSVPFSSLKQGDLFWSYGLPGGLFIKLSRGRAGAAQYAYNSYRVGVESGGHSFLDTDMVTPVNEITVS